ncbi:MAG TPA: glycosyltransferase family 39 protein [Rhodocyclaceae bacterium]|nr:glycosyltransferase family 39 protein [Rhodocyclaceae bacterium]
MPIPSRQNLFLFVAFLSSLILMQASIECGRLAHDITYDDIAYVNDGADRLAALHENGPLSFILTFFTNPPHSPYTTVLAILSLSFFGLHDFGFYLLNSVIVVGATFFLLKTFEADRYPTVIWACAFFILSPMSYSAIENFKPDISLGLVTAAMTFFAARAATEDVNRYYVLSGVAFGAALLIKPTFFPHTLAMTFVAGVSCVIIGIIRGRIFIRRAIRGCLISVVIGIAISLPYYLLAGRRIFQYFWSNTQGSEARIWSFPEGYSVADTIYHFFVDGYQRDAGFNLYLAGVLTFFSILILVLKRDWKAVFQVVFLVISAAASFVILVAGRHMNHQFFASFHALLFLAAIVGSVSVARRLRPAVYALWMLILAAGLSFIAFGSHRFVERDALTENLRVASVNGQLARVVAQELRGSGKEHSVNNPVKIFVTVAGPVNSETIKWEARKLGVYSVAFDQSRTADLNIILDTVLRSDFVIIPINSEAEYFQRFPSTAVQWQVSRRIMTDPNYRRIAYGENEHYAIFAKNALEQQRVFNVEGDAIAQGFGQEIGPFPQWGLPKVRWMTDPQATLCFTIGGNYLVEMTVRKSRDGQVVISGGGDGSKARIEVKGNVAARETVELVLPNALPCIHIESEPNSTDEGGYLLFSRLNVRRF